MVSGKKTPPPPDVRQCWTLRCWR